MKFPNYFADCESDYKDAEYVIFGVPYDKTSSFRSGAKKAPYEIRQASWNFETFNFRSDFDITDIKIHDYGDLEVESFDTKTMLEKVYKISKKIIQDKKIPICIGGEHSITPGIIKSFADDIAVLSLDAHMDFRKQYENDKNNHACVVRRINDYIPVENIAILGVRSAEKEEYKEALEQKLFFIDSFEINEKGIDNAIKKTKDYLGDKKIYLTFDIDALDPAFAPGTSTPEPFGMNPFDVLKIIDSIGSNVIGFDIVEVCPTYDNGETALIAAKFLRYIIEKSFLKI